MTILLIEDNLWLAELYADVLERAGYDVVIADSAAKGLFLLDEQSVSAIILDLFLPGANGIALLQELRSYADLAAIPVVVHSAVMPDQCGLNPDQWRQYGVVQYVPKMTSRPQALVHALSEIGL